MTFLGLVQNIAESIIRLMSIVPSLDISYVEATYPCRAV
jgi:hypothetical protein